MTSPGEPEERSERDDPQTAYRTAKDARGETARRAERRAGRVSHARLGVFVVGVGLAFLVFGRGEVAPGWLAAAALAFMVLVVVHDQILRRAAQARRAEAYYAAGLRRLGGHFVELPWGDPGRDTTRHPYADDLDCLGKGSLFHRIDAARTRVGQQRLADWLLEAAPPDTVRRRQAAVADLRPRLALREALGTLGEEAKEALESDALVRWGHGDPVHFAPGLRIAAGVLPACTLLAIVAWWLGFVPPLAILFPLSVQMGFAAALRSRVQAVAHAVEAPARDLALLGELLSRVEDASLEADRLRELQQVLVGPESGASRRLRELRRRVDLIDARRNQLFAPIAALLLWTTQLAFSLEEWRTSHGGELSGWIDAYGEVEALVSLATYAFERPDDVFPELLDGGPVRFEARGLGHPLLAPAGCVRNDLEIGEKRRLVVISGSNMSGKSTLLRAVGVNAVLAQAGAPVCARELRISPVQVGASVQLRDSLLGGQSRFYAEIQRLARVFELSEREAPPVLFLLDEILHGTNAQERRTGAEAVVRGLLARGAAGLVTTHDLALAEMVDEHAPAAVNLHFADRVEDGVLRFDYRLRDGVAGQGNALALMRAVGLPV